MSWTKEDVKILIELKKKDYTANQIAKNLGNGKTRSAVIGKINRLGLSRPKNVGAGTGRHMKGKEAKPTSYQLKHIKVKGIRHIPLLDLKRNECRFPTSYEGKHLFCGKHAENGLYCEEHHSLCHRKARKRRSSNRADGWSHI
jgi:GcrA cell cycle regulator